MNKTVEFGIVKKGANKNFGKGRWKSFFRLIPKIRLPWALIIASFVMNLVYQFVMTKYPVYVARLSSGDFSNEALFMAIGAYVMQAVALVGSVATEGFAIAKGRMNCRGVLWENMLQADMRYYGSNNPSSLMSAITNDVITSTQTIISKIIYIIPSIYYVVRVLIQIGQYDFLLLLSVFVLIPVNYIFMILYGRWQFETNANVYRKIGGLTGYLAERVRNLMLIKTYTNEPKELENGTIASKHLYGANMQAVRVSCVGSGVDSVISLIQGLVIVVFGVLLVRDGRITMAEWVAFFLYAQTVTGQIRSWVGIWTDIKAAQGAASRLIDIIESPKESFVSQVDATEFALGDIVFDNVSFAYGDNKVVDDISFTLKKGSTNAIVGLCGSGKTTLMSLIERFYVPQEGQIKLGDTSVDKIGLKEYREHFSYVQQNAEVFGGTIRQALTYGVRHDVTDERLIEAAKLSGAYDFIEQLPEGLDTVLAVSGSSLSGGQRQRLVLAREFIKNADYMLLDEPTSALDSATTQAVQKTIFELFKDKTLVMITHDLNLISDIDQIIVLNNGVVEATGKHGELMDSCALYRELVAEQRTKGGM